MLLASPSSPFTAPDFSDADSDTPGQDQVGVLLGTVSVDPNSVTTQFSSPQFHHRHFLGVIAQRIQTPKPYDGVSTFTFLKKNTPHSPAISLAVEPNAFFKENLILGPDFDLSTAAITPASSGSAGNAKVAGDLFVQGNVYSSVTTGGSQQWAGFERLCSTTGATVSTGRS